MINGTVCYWFQFHQVQYRFDCGSGEGLVRVAGVSVSDGLWHDVRLERHGNTAEITVDDTHRSQGAAPGVNDVINLDTNDVFVGAEVRPVSPVHRGLDDVRLGFVGCLDDIRLNDSLLPQHIANSPASINSLGSHNSNQLATLKRFTNVEFVCRVSLDRPGNFIKIFLSFVPVPFRCPFRCPFLCPFLLKLFCA